VPLPLSVFFKLADDFCKGSSKPVTIPLFEIGGEVPNLPSFLWKGFPPLNLSIKVVIS
jgi:hypothetical protein